MPFLYFLGLLFGTYHYIWPILPNDLNMSRCFLTTGIPCVGIGWLIAKYKGKFDKYLKYPVIWILIIGLLAEGEAQLFAYKFGLILFVGDYFALTFPLATIVFITALRYPMLGKGSFFEKWGKDYSLYLYIFHMLIIDMAFNWLMEIRPIIFIPFIVFPATLIFSYVWIKASERVITRSRIMSKSNN